MKSDPGLLIAMDGYTVQSPPDKLVMDTRGNIFHFFRRIEKGGKLDYNYDFNTGKLSSYVIRHGLGYPPFYIGWSYGKSGGILNMVETSELPSGAGDIYCDNTNIYATPSGAYQMYLTVGTYNLESPPDYTFYIP